MSGTNNNARALRERKNGLAVTGADLAKAGPTAAVAEGPRTYSDVVASRPPTPEAVRAKGLDSVSHPAVNNNARDGPNESTMSKLTSLLPSDDSTSNEWTTVSHRRRASFPSVRELHGSSAKNSFASTPLKPGLTADQGITVQAAEAQLTEEQRQRIHNRDAEMARTSALASESSGGTSEPLISFSEDTPSLSNKAGPSNLKGKGPDVRNWGGARISEDEMDLDAQRKEFEMWKELKAFQDREASLKAALSEHQSSVKDWIGKASVTFEAPVVRSNSDSDSSVTSKVHKTHRKPKVKTSPSTRVKSEVLSPPTTNQGLPPVLPNVKRSATPYSATMKQAVSNAVDAGKGAPRTRATTNTPIARAAAVRPVAQLAPNGYIHRALDGAGGPPSDSSSSSSSSSDSSTSESSSESSSSSGSDRRRRKRRAKKSRKPRNSKKEMNPKEPAEYLGAADARLFFRFVTEGTHYVKQGHIRTKRQVFVLSYFLKGKAYDFFTQEVAMDAASWKLRPFFEALFNYCFPLDYRLEQKAKLKRCYQNSLTVAEYVQNLGELFNTIAMSIPRTWLINFGLVSDHTFKKGCG
ncbi:hypothetical protein B0H17DRAFT_1199744 [Mycena rosella]|uniref:Retrotransposon gag domain-containing protein n=1 Tax=Mycena rosella TaxID=1033263 RepID=A0AAD7DMC5_MYCRO|nr:hypothetical protein B0H17DRAFT_1199744 [Mycena rosella]